MSVGPLIEKVDPVRYRDYLRLLNRVFTCFERYYADIEKDAGISEAESVSYFARRFLQTIASLRLKYMYSPSYVRRPGVDLAYTGFPHAYDISTLYADVSTKAERLVKLPSSEALKSMLLENVMTIPELESEERHLAQRIHRLYQLSDRAFLEGLDIGVQFFTYTPGKLDVVAQDDYTEVGRRAYVYSWGTFEHERNAPILYTMLFGQDEHDPPFDISSAEFEKFRDTIGHITAHTPEKLSMVACQIDDSFRTLYPKTLKRILIGPLVSPLFYKGEGELDPKSLAARILPALRRAGSEDSDFVLFFDVEVVVSARESPPREQYGYTKVRQIYQIDHVRSEVERLGASAVQRFVIMPMWLQQHLTEADIDQLPEFRGAQRLLSQNDREGVIHVG